MAQSSFALMTTLGRAKEAAAFASGGTVEITHIAIGDGATVPSGGETALYKEVARKPIVGHGVVAGAANVAYFDCFLAAEDGPYTISEAGLFDSAGDLIAIARYDPPIAKPIPASGQTVEGTIRLEVAFSNVANITIVVDGAMQVALQRLTRLPWIPIISMTTIAPPGVPSIGDTYLIPAGATGAWTGQTGKIAEYTTAGWAIASPPNGHGVCLPDGRLYVRRGGSYTEFLATPAVFGLTRLATAAEVMAGVAADRTITPATLAAGIGAYIGGDALTLWVRGDGNDANDGRENTAASAFKTLQGAMNFAMGRYGPGGKPIVLRLGLPGTYDNTKFVAGSAITIYGNPAQPSDYTIVNTDSMSVVAVSNSYVMLDGVSLQEVAGGRHVVDATTGGTVDLMNILFKAGVGPQGCIRAAYGAVVRLLGPVTLAADAASGLVSIGGSINSLVSNTITFAGNPVFSDAAVSASNAGAIYLSGTTMLGAASGQRYRSVTNAVIDTGGGGANFIPGDVAGATATGGVYV